MTITYIYKNDKSAFAKLCVVLYFIYLFFGRPNTVPRVPPHGLFSFGGLTCSVLSEAVSVLSRCFDLLCVEECPNMVLKRVYRGEVECESVTPTCADSHGGL